MRPVEMRVSVEGSAIVVVLAAILLLSAMGLALVLLSMTETLAAGNAARANAAHYAAEAGIERALPDLLHAPDWNAVLEGRLTSGFVDGAPQGPRVLADGRVIDLDEVVNLANCGSASPCTSAQMDASTEDRPWGRNNPRWVVFAYGPLAALVPSADLPPPEYLVVLVADDPAENDDDPARDGRGAANPGAGLILVRAEAFGPESAHRVVEATFSRGSPGSVEAGYAAQRGQGSAAGGSPAGGVQMPGGTLRQSEMSVNGGTARQ